MSISKSVRSFLISRQTFEYVVFKLDILGLNLPINSSHYKSKIPKTFVENHTKKHLLK